ncbi:MAG: hypothetical protein ACOZAI_04935 [Pseudomonadota bacterium]
MSITLTDGTTTLTLPGDLDWTDEYEWTPVAQSAPRYSVDGRLFVIKGTKQAGRPITLQSGDDRAWISRADVDQLHAWASVAGQQLTLTLRGVARTVMFDHAAAPVEAQMVMFYGDPVPEDRYTITLKFLEL